jgi:hypothetical protein
VINDQWLVFDSDSENRLLLVDQGKLAPGGYD